MKRKGLINFLFCFTVLFPCFSQAQNTIQNRIIKKTQFSSPIESVCWNPDGTSYITTEGKNLHFWDKKTNEITKTISDYEAQILLAKYSPDGASLITIYDDNSFSVQEFVTNKFHIHQKGSSEIPILDAEFINDFYTLLLPMDGKNIYSFFCLLHTNEALIKEDIKSDTYVYGLDVDRAGKNLLITSSDGKLKVLDIESKKIKYEYTGYLPVSITSEFSPNGKYFVYQTDESGLLVEAVDGSESFIITDYDKPVNTTDFSPNGKSIAVADKNGFVKVYNIEKGYVEDALKLDAGDVAFSCDFSPDGQSLLIGTKNGKVILWQPRFTSQYAPGPVIPLPPIDPENIDQIIVIEDDGTYHPDAKYVENDPNSKIEGIKVVEKTPTEEDAKDKVTISPTNPWSRLFKKGIELPTHNIFITAGMGTLNSELFWGNCKLEAGYLNYKIYPFYWGASLGFDLGIPSKKFPYRYRVGNMDIGKPVMLGFAPGAIGGFHYLFETPDILVFAEIGLGANIRMLASSSVQYPFMGKPATSFFTEFAIGAQWKFIRAEANLQLDTNFIYAVSGSIGGVINLSPKRSKSSKPQGGSN